MRRSAELTVQDDLEILSRLGFVINKRGTRYSHFESENVYDVSLSVGSSNIFVQFKYFRRQIYLVSPCRRKLSHCRAGLELQRVCISPERVCYWRTPYVLGTTARIVYRTLRPLPTATLPPGSQNSTQTVAPAYVIDRPAACRNDSEEATT
jgi:hypothetical protein